MRSSEA